MSEYIVHYDIAAVIILLTIIVHFSYKKTITTYKTKTFNILMWTSLITTLLDIATIIMLHNIKDIPLSIMYITNEAYYLAIYVMLPVCLHIYMRIVIDNNIKLIVNNIYMWVPGIIASILIILTDLQSTVFYFENDKFMYAKGRLFLYATAIFYIGFAVIHTLKNRHKISVRQEACIYFFTITLLVTMIIQMIEASLLLVQFGISIAILLCYMSLENPDDYADKLLGTYNKHAFREIYTQYIINEKPFRCLIVKADGYKYINEVIGPDSVDLVKKEVSDFLKTINKNLALFKVSDTKMALITTDPEFHWNPVIDDIIKRFKKPFKVIGGDFSLSVVMSMLSYPDKLSSVENVRDIIEYSIQKASMQGDETVIYADESLLEEGRRENHIIQLMRDALREDGFEVFYQPIYSVEKGYYTSAEALIRLKSTKIGFVGPDEFIPLAEQHGLIIDIGNYVFRTVCEFIANERLWEKGIEYIDVNLSAVQCMQDKLYEDLISVMDEYNLPYNCINLEITETADIMSSETLQNNMNKLMEKGIMFSLDDYGTGFSNITNLIKYKFHTIKLDKSMVWGAMEDKKAMYAIEYTIGMVKAMNMKLVAEGVENKEMVNTLTNLGCDFFQGYYYSKPLNKSDFYKKLGTKKLSL